MSHRSSRSLPLPVLALAWLCACAGAASGGAGDDAPASPHAPEVSDPGATRDAADGPAASDPGIASDTTEGPAASGTLDEDFLATPSLGRPTLSTVAVNAVPALDLEIYYEMGPAGGALDRESPRLGCPAREPCVVTLEGLEPNERYDYRARWRAPAGADFAAGPAGSFHTARPPGEAFVFTVQADSHLDARTDLAIYHRTLDNVASDGADFHIDLGDTFMCDKHAEPFSEVEQAAPDQATVYARYLFERGNFDRITHSLPLFLVNGNHEGEWGYLLDGSPDNLAIWAARARLRYFLPPVPNGFYTGDEHEEPNVGRRGAWYAWSWGDALFVVLDPFWSSSGRMRKEGPWALTLGRTQYDWLASTLASGTTSFTFVFIHNLVGGLDGQMRGGVEAAPFFEWGGRDLDGTWAFERERPGWELPIHDLLVRHDVSTVLHGHDHLYARQELDGVIYQAMPQPSVVNFGSGPKLAEQYHYDSGTILSSSGHLRVSVSPEAATVEYVRSFRAEDEKASRQNGQVDDSYELAPARRSGR